MGRKRKAPVDLEAEAEEHQKRRELQYQSLLAPSPLPPPPPPAPAAVATPAPALPSLTDVAPSPLPPPPTTAAPVAEPSLPQEHDVSGGYDVSTPAPESSVSQPQDAAAAGDVGAPPTSMPSMSGDMENMGYDHGAMDVDEPFGGLPAQTPGVLSERAPPTPWHDDYDMGPTSVGPVRSFFFLHANMGTFLR